MRNPCCDRKVVNRGAWSREEDQKLIDFVQAHGEGCWRSLPRQAGLLRCGKSCRFRWINYLSPDVKQGNFSDDEEDLIIKLHALLGNRWSLIAGRLPGRTDNEIKKYWNSHLRRKLVRNGIDPNNHRVNQTLTLQSRNQKPKEFEDSYSWSDGDSVSDAASCMEENGSRGMPDLNLELTISLPCDCVANEEQKNEVEGLKIEDKNSPTLVLFR